LKHRNFSDLGLAEPLRRALTERNHTTPTPIQTRAIPEFLAGRNILGIAQTGTGKTAAFALPILHRLGEKRQKEGPRRPRALVLAPTRELALQISEEFQAYAKYLSLRHAVIYGGVSQKPQVTALARGADIVIATPGRLLDLMNQRKVQLDAVGFLVLDEADRMLDMGFVRDVRKIVAALPGNRQSALFSATMPAEIAQLARELLSDPVRIEAAPSSTPIERIRQTVYHVAAGDKLALLTNILADPAASRVIVFSRTKHRANRLAAQLGKYGIDAEAIHGNKSQGARQRALSRFRTGDARLLVATDIAARGIDVDGVTHVINFEIPNDAESYVHRIGRTARAGAEGMALSFCDPNELQYLRDIERLINDRLPVASEYAATATREKPAGTRNAKGAPAPRRRRRNGRNRNRVVRSGLKAA